MRTAILTFGFVMGMAAVGLAMPLAPSPSSSNVVLIHGCHHYYAQDISGWHRHDKNCNTLRGTEQQLKAVATKKNPKQGTRSGLAKG